jgi:hypothetical protein
MRYRMRDIPRTENGMTVINTRYYGMNRTYDTAEIEDFCEQAFEGQFTSRFLRTVDRGASLYEVTHLPTGTTFDFTMGSAYNRGPTATEIMYGLCSDYRASQMDYQEFLNNYGYDGEDPNSQVLYRKCHQSGERYKAILNCDKNEWVDFGLFDEMISQY